MASNYALPAAASGKPGSRLEVLDAIRGIALCGILLVNLPHMGWLMDSARPHVPGMEWGPAAAVWWVQQLFVQGTMRGLFSMLFGAGMILFLLKGEQGPVTPARARTLMLRRLFWLFVFGCIDATLLLWPGDILYVYALAGVLVLPLWRAGPRTLAISAAILIAGLSVWSTSNQLPRLEVIAAGPALEARAAAQTPLSKTEQETLTSWQRLKAGRPDKAEDVAKERAIRLGGYRDNLVFLSGVSWEWATEVMSAWWVIDAATFMLIGMLLFRLGLLQGEADHRTYVLMVMLGYGIGVPLNAFGALMKWWMLTSAGGLADWQLLLPQLTMQPARLLVALGHLGIIHLAWRTRRRLFAPLQAFGRMAFTGYIGQSIIAALVFSGFGLGLWGRLDLAATWALALAMCIMQIAFAVMWLSHFRMGPLEWLWRTLTYGSRPRMNKAPAPAVG